jgi:hypothetical protein
VITIQDEGITAPAMIKSASTSPPKMLAIKEIKSEIFLPFKSKGTDKQQLVNC